jgi:hypothetical protein
MGITHIRLAPADEDTLTGALHTAWKLRVEKNRKGGGGKSGETTTPASAAKRRPAKRRSGK